jgi:hypothetical protein
MAAIFDFGLGAVADWIVPRLGGDRSQAGEGETTETTGHGSRRPPGGSDGAGGRTRVLVETGAEEGVPWTERCGVWLRF